MVFYAKSTTTIISGRKYNGTQTSPKVDHIKQICKISLEVPCTKKKKKKKQTNKQRQKEKERKRKEKKKKKKKAMASALPDVFRQPVKHIPRQQLADLVGR